FGVMGGFMQPQGHVQVITNTLDFHMNPQEALDAPRWQWVGGKTIEVERGFPYALTEELVRRGHDIKVLPESLTFGRGQIIWKDEQGVLTGATDSRADGTVAVW
ncbi:MAG: gamma-glutamyltransferase, partial [Clostridium sp.]